MKDNSPDESEVYEFIIDKIDSVPHLEALLLLWNTRPKCWSAADLATRLYVDPSVVRYLLQGLGRKGLINGPDDKEEYSYRSESEAADKLVEEVDRVYRWQVVRVSTLIHSKASSALRDFARAFRFTKE